MDLLTKYDNLIHFKVKDVKNGKMDVNSGKIYMFFTLTEDQARKLLVELEDSLDALRN